MGKQMMITTSDFPCKDCKDRAVGCHSICQKYIAAKEKAEQEKKNPKAEFAMDVQIEIYKRDTIRKVQKRRHTRFKRR